MRSLGAWLLIGATCASFAVRADIPPDDAAPPPHYRLVEWPRRAPSPSFDLTDVAGRRRTLNDYRGKVAVIFFGFARCPDVCPTELFKLSLVMKHLERARKSVQVLFVSLDPERDAPRLLGNYVAAFDPEFVALTGSVAQVDAAASSFHVEYAHVTVGSDYTIDHSTSTYVMDGSGRLRLIGSMQATVDDYTHDIAALAAENAAVTRQPAASPSK